MRQGDGVEAVRERPGALSGAEPVIGQGAWVPIVIAAAVLTVVAVIVVMANEPVWQLLGVGRGLFPPEYYSLSGLIVIAATTLGQFAGWLIGIGVLAFAWHLLGRPVTPLVIRLAATVIYLGLVALPLFFFHVLFGQPLAGIPREGLAEWVAANHPGAYGLLFPGHPIVDFSLIPLAVIALGLLWGFGDRVLRHRALQTLLALVVMATSLAVAFSLAIHSTLIHIRIG